MEKLVVVSDIQIDYQDDESLHAVGKFLRDFQPDTFVLNGDIVDMTALSMFRLTLEQRGSLETQREILRYYLDSWRHTLPDARIIYVMGNHEQRLHNYIDQNAAELAFLKTDELSFEGFADLHRYGIELVRPWGAGFDWHGVLITHGVLYNDNAAKSNLLKEGTSGISGHSHRLGTYYRTNRSGAHMWVQGGCLCRVDGDKPPPNRPGVDDWQQGFVVGYWDHIWNLYPVSITNHHFLFEGKAY